MRFVHLPGASTGIDTMALKSLVRGFLLVLCMLTPAFAQEPSPPPTDVDEPAGSPAQEKPDSPADAGEGEVPPDESAADEPDADFPSSDSFAFKDKEEGPARIGEIVVDGNVRVSDTAFYNNLRIKSGDEYDERAIRREFRRLWNLSLFDDMSVESRTRPSGKVDIIFHVRDRPILGSVEFVGMKAVTETAILERLSEADADVRRGQPVDYSVLRKAESAIEHMLGEKGYLEAKVRARLTPVHQGQRQVTFHIREGAKTKIKKIDFVGNTIYTDRQLRKMLKLTKQAFWLTSWASSKPLYHPAKLDQDTESIRTAYRSRGYLDMKIEPEVVELESEVKRREAGEPVDAEDAVQEDEDDTWDESREEPPPPPGETEKERKKRLKKEAKEAKKKAKKEKKSIYLTIPIEEGPQYRVGEVKIEGNTIFSDSEVMARLPLRTGMVFNDSALKYGIRQLEDDYGERGYFYVSVDPQVDKQEEATAGLTLEITEDKQYFVDRIEFTGNTTTRDKVLRREMRLGEEDLFNVRAMRLGLRKIAQLGYWQVGGDPAVQAQPDSDRLNIEVQGVEANRNEIQVGGGVSGIDGGFFQGSYSTRNFLGRGEVFSAFLTIGQIGSRYSLNFTEPWFLGKPWTLGFSLFNQQTQYSGFDRNGTGGRVILGRILGNFSRLDVIYGLEKIDFRPTQPGFFPSETTTSSITNIYSYDTRNNFFRPTRGLRLVSSLEYAGGFLGGDNNFWKFIQDATLYFPGLMKKHYFGVNVSYGYVAPLGNSVVPDFERFYLGGERTLRAFPTRSVGPERRDIDVNQNGFIDVPEDTQPDGVFQPCEDLNHNGVQDLPGERDYGDCVLDPSEDVNGNFILDTEDINNNGILDPGEDINGNGILDTEDLNGDGILQLGEDRPDGFFTPFCAADDLNMNGVRDPGEGDNGNCRLDSGEDTNLDGIFGSFFPGGNQYVLLNMEYSIPLTDTVVFSVFYDAGNSFDKDQSIQFDDLRVDYGVEMKFFLPVFQAPLRLIYAIIQDPRPGEDPSNFIFSIGTTF